MLFDDSGPVLGVLLVLLFFIAGMLIGGWLIGLAAQTMANWATDAHRSNSPRGGFPVLGAGARPSALRFAVLHHAGVAVPHFDLLFEPATGEPLVTWRSPTWPITGPTPLERQPDHRPHYLDHEGPVGPGPDGADRGHVRRVAAGTFLFNSASDEHWDVTLGDGVRLTFRRGGQADAWTAEPGAAAPQRRESRHDQVPT